MSPTPLLKALATSLLLAFAAHGHASEDEFDIDSRFRAKIAKEKVRQGALLRQAQTLGNSAGIDKQNCGSQNIGNVNTNGRPGSAPREVFVFAPNAINLVSGPGCR
jgi:hypothetical protein